MNVLNNKENILFALNNCDDYQINNDEYLMLKTLHKYRKVYREYTNTI